MGVPCRAVWYLIHWIRYKVSVRQEKEINDAIAW